MCAALQLTLLALSVVEHASPTVAVAPSTS
eukprot:SAG31_NODE_33012_length_349_cov_0.616000_1_plen_29_part_01